jgi:hypothetical protein
MRAAGPARMLFTLPRWDCRFWVSMWLKQHWRLSKRRPATVGSRLSLLRLTRSSCSVWGACFRQCWTADCSTPSMATSERDTQQVWHRVTEHNATLHVLCFSNDDPDTGPHPISQEELRAAFNRSNGWHVAAIEPDRLQTTFHDHGAPAWCATIKRL